MCVFVYTLYMSLGVSYSRASAASWAKWSFITLQKHSTVHHTQILVNIHTRKQTLSHIHSRVQQMSKYSWHTKQHVQMRKQYHSICMTLN